MEPLVHGKRVKEWFQIVYDYKLQEWTYNYRRGRAGRHTFRGYVAGDEVVGADFGELQAIDGLEYPLADLRPRPTPDHHQPDPAPVEPDHPAAPEEDQPRWETVFQGVGYRVQELS